MQSLPVAEARDYRAGSHKATCTSDQRQPVDPFKQPEHLLGPQICALCERNISKSVKVLCAEDQQVADGDQAGKPHDLVICLECLRTGKTSAEYPNHNKDCDYYIYDNLEFPLLCKEWTAFEEIRLI